MKPMIVVMLFLTGSCQFITVTPETSPAVSGAITPYPGQTAPPYPASNQITLSKFKGEYRLDHLTGITALIFDGSSNVKIHYYNRKDGKSFVNYYPMYVTSTHITTYSGKYPIEEFGEFFDRPYRFEGNYLIITGMDTNGVNPLDFKFRKVY
jgi:hypothetical protein